MANLLRRIFCFRTESATQSVYIQDELNAPYRSNSEKLSGPKLVEQLRADLNRAIEEKETLELRCIQKNKEILDLLKMQVACDIDAMIDEGKLCVTATVTTPRSIERTVISKVGVKLDMASVEPLVSWVTVPRCPYCQQPFGGSDSAKQPFTLGKSILSVTLFMISFSVRSLALPELHQRSDDGDARTHENLERAQMPNVPLQPDGRQSAASEELLAAQDRGRDDSSPHNFSVKPFEGKTCLVTLLVTVTCCSKRQLSCSLSVL